MPANPSHTFDRTVVVPNPGNMQAALNVAGLVQNTADIDDGEQPNGSFTGVGTNGPVAFVIMTSIATPGNYTTAQGVLDSYVLV